MRKGPNSPESADVSTLERLHPGFSDQPPPIETKPSQIEEPLSGLYARQFANLKNYIRRLVGGGPPDPEDVAQAAFAKLAARDRLDDIENLSGFLWRTAQNIVISEQRASAVKIKRAADLEEIFSTSATDELDPERVLISRAEVSVVISVLKTLSEKKRRIFLMSRVDGLNNAEIGRRLGLSRSTVSQHLSQVMLQLDAAMNEFDGEG